MKSRPKTSHVGDVTIWTFYVLTSKIWVTAYYRPGVYIKVEYEGVTFQPSDFVTCSSRRLATWSHYFNRGLEGALHTPVGSHPQPLKVSYLHRRRR